MSLLDQLRAAVGAEHVEIVDERSWRVSPGSAAEVAEVIRRAGEHRAAVHAIGAGSRSPIATLGRIGRSPTLPPTRSERSAVVHLREP